MRQAQEALLTGKTRRLTDVMDTAGISVVIPTFNRSELCIRALGSVHPEDVDFPLEIIVSDNGSTDGTYGAVDSWRSAHPSVDMHIHRFPVNVGALQNWTYAVDRAKYPWLKVLWSDDWLEPGALHQMREVVLKEQVSTVTCGARIHTHATRSICLYDQWSGSYNFSDAVHAWLWGGTRFPVSPAAALVSTDIARDALDLSRRLGVCAQRAIGPDMIMVLLAAARGANSRHLQQILVNFEGRNVSSQDPSITVSTKTKELQVCYDAAIWLMMEATGTFLDNSDLALLEHRAFEARISRTAGHRSLPWKLPHIRHLRGSLRRLRS